jgi:hypothetical protein
MEFRNKAKNLINEARKDPTLAASIDINDLLESLEDVENDYIENKTLSSISQDIFNVLVNSGYGDDFIKENIDKLKDTMYVDEFNEFKGGRSAYALKKHPDPNKKNRLIKFHFCSLSFKNNTTYILGIFGPNKWCSYIFDNFYFFQTLNDKDKMILSAYEKMENGEDLTEDEDDEDEDDYE